MRYLSFFSLLFLSLVFTACGGDAATAEADTMEDTTTTESDATMAKVALTPMPATTEFPDAAITKWGYQNGTFTYGTTGYEFGVGTPDADALMCANSGQGQHVHLIIDNEPYIAKYEPTFEQPVTDGEHIILTFLSRSYHESIKTPAAHRAWKVIVENGSFADFKDVQDPMLFYSRPKGTYTGKKETENVMLDFYPINAQLGDKYQVKAVVNGKDEFMINEWRPYYLTGLPMGENTVELTLMQGGVAVDTPLNPVTRKFELKELPTGE